MPIYTPPIDFDLSTAAIVPPGSYVSGGDDYITSTVGGTPVFTFDGWVVDPEEFYEFAVTVGRLVEISHPHLIEDAIDFEIRMVPATGDPIDAWNSGDQVVAGNVTVEVEDLPGYPGPFVISANIGPGINQWDLGVANGWTRLFFAARWASSDEVFTQIYRTQLIGEAAPCLRNAERSSCIRFKEPDGSWFDLTLVGSP